jgi:transcriptional regulator with PAS, ATPase and Fis domain
MAPPHAIVTEKDFQQLMENPLFQQMFDSLSIGVSITDPSGTIRFFSKPCYEIHGLDPADVVVGRKIDTLFQTASAGILDSLHTKKLNTVNSVLFNGVEGICRRSPIIDKNGNLVCCLTEALTTTHDKKRIDELLQGISQLKRKAGYIISPAATNANGLHSFEDVAGESAAITQLKSIGRRFARSREPVLITGETGTGKELFAQAIHKASPRAAGSFVSVNCAALPRELAESELFGYVEGAFTGAKKGGRKGKFELADKGTIFLDEIGELPHHLQAKLLRVLECNEIQKIGSNDNNYSDFRLVAATNRDLPEMVRRRQFREDLYHRLNILEMRLPSLREHREDIPHLCVQFLESICGPQKALEVRLSPDVYALFMRYMWPGNIRELKNALAYAYCCMDDDDLIMSPHNLPQRILGVGQPPSQLLPIPDPQQFQATQRAVNKHAIELALSATGNNKSRAAKLLGISRNTLYLRMKALGIPANGGE